MAVTDYYGETIISKLGYGLGRGVRTAQVVTVQQINPLKAGAAVAALWGSFTALVNYSRYKKGKITKKDAIKVTASESAGMGISAGVGLVADTLLKTYVLAATASPAIPLAAAVVATGLTKIVWDCKTGKNVMWCGCDRSQNDQI